MKPIHIPLCILLLSVSSVEAAPAVTPSIPSPGHPIWSVQIDYTKSHDALWTEPDFKAIAKEGMNRVEINLNWGDIEPRKGHYDFRVLDQYLDSIAKARLKLILIFWESVWHEQQAKNPPAWLKARDITSDGITAKEPPWWGKASRQAYFDYVARTIDHVKNRPGFGGVFANYGWLDAMWGPRPKGSHGVTGYAPADIDAFHHWLSHTYKTIAAFNQRWHTKYRVWNDVPAAKPGDPLFALYQKFRYYSVESAYRSLSELVRAHTNGPLFYYWGGSMGGHGGAAVLGNDPDLFFRAAKRYHATIVFDDADQSGLALIFGSLAHFYQVPLMQEWTPSAKDLKAEAPQWLGHIALASTFEVGEDFFIYPIRPRFEYAWSLYRTWHTTLAAIRGGTPTSPVAVIIPTGEMATETDLDAFSGLNKEISSFWRKNRVVPDFITDQQIQRGVIQLGRFKAIVNLAHTTSGMPQLAAHAAKHKVLSSLDAALPYLVSYAKVNPAYDSLEIIPVVDGSSAWLTLANCEEQAYDGSLIFEPSAVGLPRGAYQVEDAQTHRAISATLMKDGHLRIPLSLPPAGFDVLYLQAQAPN